MATPLSSVTNELQILHSMIDHPEQIIQLKDNYFLTGEGKDLYMVLYSLHEGHVKPTLENVVGAGNTVNQAITPELYSQITATMYDPRGFEHYRYLLQEAYAQDRIETTVLKEITKGVTTKGRLDIERMKALSDELNDCIMIAQGRGSDILTTKELFQNYEATMQQRVDGEEFHSTGCSRLDSVLPTGFAPGEITTIFGSTGVGKSTYSLYLINRLVNRDIPCLYISLEMSETATMDRWMASRLRIPLSQLVGRPNEPVDESIVSLIQNERDKLLKRKRFGMVDAASMTIIEVEKTITQFKMRTDAEYATVFIDLATMLRDFSGGDPREYEKAIDLLHLVAKRTNTHIVLIVQAIQKTLENHRPTTLMGVNIFRPTLASIKNSGAIAERSRTVLSVFRAKYYALRFFPDDPQVDELEDVVEVQVLKSSNGNVGSRVQYIHDEGLFRLLAVPEDYIPRTISNLNGSSEDDEL